MVRALPGTGLAILTGDDPNVLWMRDSSCARIVTYGFGDRNDLHANDVRSNLHAGTRFTLHMAGAQYEVSIHLVGRHMVYPILAAVAVAAEFGIDDAEALSRIEGTPPMPERLELARTRSGVFLLIDTFKSHLETVNAALDALEDLPAARKLVVLGEVEEPPGSAGPVYRALGRRVAEVAARVIFVGGRRQLSPLSSGATAAGMSRNALQFAKRSPREAAALVQRLVQPNDLVLIIGRSTQKLARVAFALQGRSVRCDIPTCALKSGCAECDQLEVVPRRGEAGESWG